MHIHKEHAVLRFRGHTNRLFWLSTKTETRGLHVEDQQDTVNNINWTCLYGAMDGNTWVADRNSGQKPRIVIDIRVPIKYKPQAEVFENPEEFNEAFIRSFYHAFRCFINIFLYYPKGTDKNFDKFLNKFPFYILIDME